MTKEINNSPVTVEEAVAARPDYENEIIAVVRGTASPKAAQQKLEDYHGNDIAQAMASLTLPERKKLFRICTADMLAEAFEHLEEEDAVAYFNEMDVQKASAVTEKLDAETAVDILHGIEKEKRALIIDALPQDVRRDIRLLASFDEDEIGSKMTTDCVVLRENLSVPEAMAELVRQAEENDNIATIFVVDEDDEFYGAMELRDLITAKKDTPLDDLIVTSFPYVYAHESIDDCIEKFGYHHRPERDRGRGRRDGRGLRQAGRLDRRGGPEGAAAAQHAKAFAVAVCPARSRHFGIDGRRRV